MREQLRPRSGALVSAALAALALAGALPGCAGYTLRGRVIAGDVSYVAVVEASDPRLAAPGLAGAEVDLVSDPDRARRKRIASGVTDGAGEFSLPVAETGAGFLNYDVALSVRREGYATAQNVFLLPSGSKRVLVILKAGAPGRSGAEEDLLKEFERYSK